MESMILKNDKEEQELEEIEIKYLFPYFFRFDKNNGTKILKEGVTKLKHDQLILFNKYMCDALSELLIDCYHEPSIKNRQKHSTFFEQFEFEGKKYIVDYTTSILGRLMYTLYLRQSFVQQTIESSKGELLLRRVGKKT